MLPRCSRLQKHLELTVPEMFCRQQDGRGRGGAGDARADSERRVTVAFMLAVFAFVYLHQFALPATPSAEYRDESLVLAHATRMYQGEVIYRDGRLIV